MNNGITLKKENYGVVLPWSQIAIKSPFVTIAGQVVVKSTGNSRFNFFTNEVDYPGPDEKVSVLRYVDVEVVEI